MMPDETTQPILEFDNVTVESEPGVYDAPIWKVSFALRPGELMLIKLERNQSRIPLMDAATGLVDPSTGSVRMGGRDWRELSPREAAKQRGQIGRVFDESGWVSGLDLDENVILAQRHHSRRKADEIRDEAARLARIFSLPGLPRGRPGQVRRQDLRRAGLIRALLGHPLLLLLDQPTRGIYPDAMPPLMSSLRAARQRGAAVLWLTDESQVWNDRGIKATVRGTMGGAQLQFLAAPEPAAATPDVGVNI